MVNIITTHINAPGCAGILQKKTRFSEPTFKIIKQYVEETVESEISSKDKFIIEMQVGQDWFELDTRYMSPDERLVKQNSSENEQIINLKVTWTKKNDICLSQTLSYNDIITIDNPVFGANHNMLSSDHSQTISAPAETISQDKINQHDDEYADNVEPIDQQWPIKDLRSICPLLVELENTLTHRSLCSDDVKAVSSICLLLAKNHKKMPQFISDISEIPGFNERLVLFASEHLEIRAHLFKEGAKEGFIHNHQWSFISCCLQGTYRHRIHGIIQDNGKHYVSYRETGGSYSDRTERSGTSTNIVDQPFSAGQCMFLSAHGFHTVEPQSGEPVVTLVFRYKQSVHEKATVIHSSLNLVGYNPESVHPILDISHINKIKVAFTTVLKQYHQRQPMTLA